MEIQRVCGRCEGEGEIEVSVDRFDALRGEHSTREHAEACECCGGTGLVWAVVEVPAVPVPRTPVRVPRLAGRPSVAAARTFVAMVTASALALALMAAAPEQPRPPVEELDAWGEAQLTELLSVVDFYPAVGA